MDTLANQPIGKTAMVAAIHGSDALAHRLMSMGLLPGVEAKVIQYAPLGDPVIIEFDQQRFAMRLEEARTVEVTR